MMRRRLVPVLSILLLVAVVAGAIDGGGGVAHAASPTCAAWGGPTYAHPGRERTIYVNCDDGAYPQTATYDAPEHGTLVAFSNLTATYRPDDGYAGPDSFTVHGVDAGGQPWAPFTVPITVSTTLSGAPNCSYGSNGVVRDGETRPVHILSCEDPEGDPVAFAVITPPAHGTLGPPVASHRGTRNTAEWPYTPDPGFTGTDTFTYQGTDDFGVPGALRAAAVVVRAAGQNAVPTCVDFGGMPGGVPVHGSGGLAVSCRDDDEDPITLTITSAPAHGTLAVEQGNRLNYVPEPGYTGTITYAFTAADDHGGVSPTQSRTASVGPNHAPTCTDKRVTAPVRLAARAVALELAAPCDDPDHDGLAVVVDTPPAHGTLTPAFPGRQYLYYVPDRGWTGEDTATFHVTDSYGGTSGAPSTITFVVDDPAAPEHDAPAGGGATPQQPPAEQLVGRQATAPHTPIDTAAARATALLRATAKPLSLGLGAVARGYVTTVRRVASGTRLVVVFCAGGCALGVDGTIALGGATTARPLALAHRSLKVTAAHPGVVTLALTKAQRRRVARAAKPTLTLTLKTTAGGKTTKTRRAFALRR
jgi:Bacterial Ig domain